MKLANRVNGMKQQGFLRSTAALLLGLLLLFFAQFSHSALTVTIGAPANMTSVQIPGPLSAEALVTATLADFNETTLVFDQADLVLEAGTASPLTLTLTNTGVNDLDNGSIVLSFPAGVTPVFAVSPLYTVVQQPDGSWLITLVNPLLPAASIPVVMQLEVAADTPDAVAEIQASFTANAALLDNTKASVVIGKANAGLFLVHQVDKNVVEHDEAVVYTLSLTNQLPISANDIVLNTMLPAGVRFISGSVKINNVPVADPQIAADGRTLLFDIGNLAASETVMISYVAYVSSIAPVGELPSISKAQGSNAVSNDAGISIFVRQDAINVDSHVVGRVLVDSCSDDQKEDIGRTGMRLRSQLDGEDVLYTLTMKGSGVPVKNYQVKVSLPEALRYVDGSALLDGEPVANPHNDNGQLVFDLGDQGQAWKRQLRFRAKADQHKFGLYEATAFASYDVEGQGHQLTPTLVNTYESRFSDRQYRNFTYWPRFKTLDATLQPADIANIDGLKQALAGEVVNHITVTGHSDSQPIYGMGKTRFADNVALSEARAQSIADFLVQKLGIKADRITVVGKGDAEPVADNATAEGRQKNRRVEILVEVLDVNEYRHSDILLGEESFVIGGIYQQVLLENTGETPGSQGLAGVRLLMEDGRFVDTDSEGRYHFEGLKPGTHVIQLDPQSIPAGYEPYLCEDNTRFAGTPGSHFIDVQQGLVWRANFHLRSVDKRARIDTGLKLKSTLSDNRLSYAVQVQGTAISDAAASVMLELPAAITLQEESLLLDGKPAKAVQEAGKWRIDLPASDQSWQHEILFDAVLATDVPGEYGSAAQLRVMHAGGDVQLGQVVSNVLKVEKPNTRVERYNFGTHFADASSTLGNADKSSLQDIAFMFKGKNIRKVEVIDHGDDAEVDITAGETLSQLRAQTMADYLAQQLQLAPGKVVVLGTSSRDASTVIEGAAGSRRVEIFVHSNEDNAPPVATLIKPESRMQLDALHLLENPQVQDAASPGSKAAIIPEGILSLQEGDVLAGTFGSVRISLDSRLTQELYVDGQKVPDSRIGFRKADPATNKTIYTYFGVNLGEPGEHKLQLKGIDPFGNARLDQVVNYSRSGDIRDIRFISAEGNVADGKTAVTARVQLIDEHGKTINAATDLLVVEGELQPFVEGVDDKIPLVKDSNRMVSVARDGAIKFKPVHKSGLYRMRLQYNNVETELKIYVKPEYREWVMVGLADGVAGYKDVAGNMQSLAADDIEEEYYDDGKLAFYAKGRVAGKYLLTVAFDSSKKNEQDERLLQMIDPNEYYTLYGDNAEQQYDAASKEKLYLRLDADNFYALFGDFNTELTVTELSRYARSFTGARAVYESEHVSVNAFAAQTAQLFTHDEILGDGTSGLYTLSRKNIVINSERIIVQVRDRFHSERIISEQPLNRFVDYSLDYISGTLYFKQPIARHDENFNPVYIVVDYEAQGNGNEALVGGGRAAVKMADDKVELGITHIDEGMEGAEGQLSGVDARFDFTRQLQLKAEYATSQKTELASDVEADAYLAELLHRGEKMESSIYVREQQSGFGLNQLNRSELGTRKYGARGTAILQEDLELVADAGHEQNLENAAERDLLFSNLVYSPEDWEFNVGATLADDMAVNGDSFRSEMLNTGIVRKMLDERLRLYERSEWQLNDDPANVDYPERHIVGTDFLVTDDVDVYAEYEFANSEIIESESTRAGLRTRPWANATMNNGVQRDINDIQARTFAVFGLTQAVPFADNWRASFSYDQTNTIDRKLYNRVNENMPLASGSSGSFISTNAVTDEDFWATTAGVGYQSGLYLFDSRAEYREAETQTKYGAFVGWQRNLLEGIGHALRLQTFITDDVAFGEQLDAQLRYSAVIRPPGGDVFWFNRSELKHLNLDAFNAASKTDKFVEHLAINWVPDVDWQVATHLGYKLTRSDGGTSVFTTDTYLLGNETRYDLTPRWDIGAHYHIITTPDMGLTKNSYGLSVGVDVAKNLWLSMGFNFAGYSDDDFDANGYTAKGPFLKLRFKFDQDTFNLND